MKLLRTSLLAGVIALYSWAPSAVSSETGRVKQRAEIEDKYKWDLGELFASDSAWETGMGQFKAMIPQMEQFKGQLGRSSQTLLHCLALRDTIGLLSERLYVYAYLRLDEDNRVGATQEMGGRISALGAELDQVTSYIRPELLALDASKVTAMLAESHKLKVYEFYLSNLQRQKQFVLPAREEELLALAGPATRVPSDVFQMLNDADIKYGTIKDETGNDVELTKERYSAFLESRDRRVRRDAMDTYTGAYLKYQNGLAAALSGSVQQDWFYTQARGYKSCLENSLSQDNIPPAVFHALLAAVNSNLAPLHKWATLRKRILGIDTLRPYDLYVPLNSSADKTYTYEEAKAKIIDGLRPLGADYITNFSKGLNSRWVDVFETEGKGSGAYQWGSYKTHPVLLMNFSGTLESVFTLAHEMGHAMHSFYTDRTEPFIYHDHSLFNAEVGSTCNEAVLMKYLLKNAKSKEEKMYLLNYYIEQIIGTFYTQVMFSEFEIAIHETVESGGALSAESMRKTYRDIYQKFWGPELVIGENHDLAGLRISHFYRMYYVYQYATCYAAAQALSQRIFDDGKKFLPTYMQFLSTGTSMYPVDNLKRAGVDMTTSEPVDKTIKLFGELVDQMEVLLNQN
jgi:oligoendopeptidase F